MNPRPLPLILLLIVGAVRILTEPFDSTEVRWLMVGVIFLQLYFQLRMSFSVQALIGEDLSPKDAMIRSWKGSDQNRIGMS